MLYKPFQESVEKSGFRKWIKSSLLYCAIPSGGTSTNTQEWLAGYFHAV